MEGEEVERGGLEPLHERMNFFVVLRLRRRIELLV